eukprot:jgi/Bigna1/60029/fgenesh1_kg.8_\
MMALRSLMSRLYSKFRDLSESYPVSVSVNSTMLKAPVLSWNPEICFNFYIRQTGLIKDDPS